MNGEQVRITANNVLAHIRAYVVTYSSVFSAGERRDRMVLSAYHKQRIVQLCFAHFPSLFAV